MHLRDLGNIDSHGAANRFLGDRDHKQLAHNTTIRRVGDDIAVTYHRTDIVTFHADHSITIDDGGWPTATTIMRLHALTPRNVCVRKEPGEAQTVYKVAGDIEWRLNGPTRLEMA